MSLDPARAGMVAGEASGDLLGAHLLEALLRRRPGLHAAGIGGPRMQALGFETYHPMEKLSVRGYVEVLRHYREIMGIRRALAQRLREERPAIFVGIDAPDFNLELERELGEAGIPAVHYVGPSIWAWRGWRMRRIARSAARVLTLFPFEAALYERAGVPVTYVGHPLADAIPLDPDKAEARAQLRLPKRIPLVALLPGSRQSELHYMAELFVKAAHRLYGEIGQVQFVCPASSRGTKEQFEQAIRLHGAPDLPITVLFGHSHEALAAADVALVASGTATLEAALFKTPMIITYRMAPATWMLMRHMLYLPWIGLPNILAGDSIVPEYVQGRATPWALAAALLELLHDPAAQRRQVERFGEMHGQLRRNAAERAAEAVLETLDAARG